MHAFYNAIRFEHEIIPASVHFDNRAIVARAREDFLRSPMQGMQQDLVEQPVFAQSAEFH